MGELVDNRGEFLKDACHDLREDGVSMAAE